MHFVCAEATTQLPSGVVSVLVPLFVQLHTIPIKLGLQEEWHVFHQFYHLERVGSMERIKKMGEEERARRG